MHKPNFSGTWRFNPATSALQIPAPDSTMFVVDHREPLLLISRTHIVGERRDTFSLALTTDCQEVLVDRDDLRLRCRAYWDVDALVFDSELIRAGVEATNVVRYALTNGGKTLRAEEQFRSSSLNYENLWILDRVELY